MHFFNFRCVLAAPYLACLKGDSSLAILFLVHLFDTNSQPQSVTINTIFGAGAQGPYHLESVLGEEPVISISADNNQRKRIFLVGEVPVPIQKDIIGDAMLYIVSVDNEKVLLETTYKNGVSILYSNYIIKDLKKKKKVIIKTSLNIFLGNRNCCFGTFNIKTYTKFIY